ncbi:type V toxin-antitoxin system endoribonuclease antitoxin GhoS [Salmonella enterica subsp. enterica serovar Newport]
MNELAKYTVRVELRNSQDADYEELHEKMKAKLFSRMITTDSGNSYYLPNAEYNYICRAGEKEKVAKLAESVASRISKNPKILVTESNGRSVMNLDEC